MYVVSKRNRIVKSLRIDSLQNVSKTSRQNRRFAQNADDKPQARAEVIIEREGIDFETIVSAQLFSQQAMQAEDLSSFQTIGIDAYEAALGRKAVRLANGTYYQDQA